MRASMPRSCPVVRLLELALDRDGPAELVDQLGDGELERVEADLEGGLLVEVALPVDAARLLFGFELLEPAVAERVADLVERERL